MRPVGTLALSVTDGIRTILSSWRPDSEELALLNAGGLVWVSIVGGDAPTLSLLVKQAAPAEKPKGGDLARLASIWCNDPDFQKWIMATDAQSARKKICLKCGVTSRAELDHNKVAAQYFHKLIRIPYRDHLQRKGGTHGSH